MSNTQTLLQLRTSVQAHGQYENSTDITPAILNDYINKSIAQLWNIIVEKWQDYYLKSATVSVVSGTGSYSLPTDFYKLRKVEIQLDSTRQGRLFPVDLVDQHRYVSGDALHRYKYRIAPPNLVLVPTPQTTETLTLYYIPYATRLVNDSDTFDGINQYEDLVVAMALRRCLFREGLDTQGIDAEIGMLAASIRTAADGLDASEPFYLGDYGGDEGPSGGGSGFGGWGW